MGLVVVLAELTSADVGTPAASLPHSSLVVLVIRGDGSSAPSFGHL